MKNNNIDSSKIKILICCHKKCELPKDDIFLPIQVGAAISDVDLGMQRDDQINGMPCDNISAKNKSYCELTALYWAWKNIKKLYPNLEYIGVNHYRRFFDFDKRFSLRDVFHMPEEACKNYKLNKKRLFKELSKGNSIVAKKKNFPHSLKTDYCCCHYSDDIENLERTVEELFPDAKDALVKTIEQNNILSPYNMMIIKWGDFCNYCEWLFSILSELETRINISDYNDIQKRIYGYMAERLFNVWIFYRTIKTVQYPVLWYTEKKLPELLDLLIKKHRNNSAFSKTLTLRVKIARFLLSFFYIKKFLKNHKKGN